MPSRQAMSCGTPSSPASAASTRASRAAARRANQRSPKWAARVSRRIQRRSSSKTISMRPRASDLRSSVRRPDMTGPSMDASILAQAGAWSRPRTGLHRAVGDPGRIIDEAFVIGPRRIQGQAEQALRQAQGERYVVDSVRGERVEPRSESTPSAMPQREPGVDRWPCHGTVLAKAGSRLGHLRSRRLLVACVGGAQQVVEVPDTALASGAQASGVIGAGRETLLHRLADGDVLDLHFVAELRVARDPRLRLFVFRVVEIELDAATTRTQRDDPIGLQSTGHDVEHDVGIDVVVERLAFAVEGSAVAQR